MPMSNLLTFNPIPTKTLHNGPHPYPHPQVPKERQSRARDSREAVTNPAISQQTVRIIHMNKRLLYLINLLFVGPPYERVLVFLLDIWRQRLRQQFFHPADIRIIVVLQNEWKQEIKNLWSKQQLGRG